MRTNPDPASCSIIRPTSNIAADATTMITSSGIRLMSRHQPRSQRDACGSSVYIQDCNNRRPAWHTADGDQLGPFQLIQAPGGREPGEAELGPIIQRQLELGRSVPTRQETTHRRSLRAFLGGATSLEPRVSRNRPVQWPTLSTRSPAPRDPRQRPRRLQPGSRRTASQNRLTLPRVSHGGLNPW